MQVIELIVVWVGCIYVIYTNPLLVAPYAYAIATGLTHIMTVAHSHESSTIVDKAANMFIPAVEMGWFATFIIMLQVSYWWVAATYLIAMLGVFFFIYIVIATALVATPKHRSMMYISAHLIYMASWLLVQWYIPDQVVRLNVTLIWWIGVGLVRDGCNFTMFGGIL